MAALWRERIGELIHTGRLEITPDSRRNEVLGFLGGEVHDLSVSRPHRGGSAGAADPVTRGAKRAA